jgi:hypothetical protein
VAIFEHAPARPGAFWARRRPVFPRSIQHHTFAANLLRRLETYNFREKTGQDTTARNPFINFYCPVAEGLLRSRMPIFGIT